jgi:hypothetical protein
MTRFFDEKQASTFNAVVYNENNDYHSGYYIKIRKIKNCTFLIIINL